MTVRFLIDVNLPYRFALWSGEDFAHMREQRWAPHFTVMNHLRTTAWRVLDDPMEPFAIRDRSMRGTTMVMA